MSKVKYFIRLSCKEFVIKNVSKKCNFFKFKVFFKNISLSYTLLRSSSKNIIIVTFLMVADPINVTNDCTWFELSSIFVNVNAK